VKALGFDPQHMRVRHRKNMKGQTYKMRPVFCSQRNNIWKEEENKYCLLESSLSLKSY
jgi:hypothetical protein